VAQPFSPVQALVPAGQGIRRPKKYITLTARGVCWHWTANTQKGADAKAHLQYWRKAEVGAHYIVDDTGAYQAAPDTEVVWHAGPGSLYTPEIKKKYPAGPNLSLIGVELCVNLGGNWEKTYRYAVALGAYLCKKYGFDPSKDFVRHYDCTRKDCPRMWTPYVAGGEDAWEDFKRNVLIELKAMEVIALFQDIKGHWAEKDINYLAEKKLIAPVEKFRPNDNITRTANYDLVTRLYPFGENDLDISSVNNGVKYLENFSYTPNIYVGIYQNQDIDDPQELKDKATEVLAKICQPRYTYRVGMVDLRTLPEYSHEGFALGDMVDVIDEELGINVRARIMRHRYNVFQPWQCELEIGEPEERLVAKLADAFDVAKFVQEALRPNPATSNLLKGFINTFATQINSANGKLRWNDSTLEAIEINAQGQETGKRVRITPGGIGISTDGGQTYVTAMTGAGVLANTIIVNELYALATDDGYTKLTASGLRVFDENWAERVVAGWWMDGTTKRFGLNVKAQDGATTLLDDRGILQTWQEGRAGNVDSASPLTLNVYLPPETRSIRRALLRFSRQAFRAYSTGAASGGGGTQTSTDGGAVATSTLSGGGAYRTSDVQILAPGQSQDITVGAGSHSHGGSTGSVSDHNHGIPDGTSLALAGGGSVTFRASNAHSHSISSVDNHAHVLYNHKHETEIPSHTHDISIPNHRHDVTFPSHTHGIVYGIFTGTLPIDVTVRINGVDRTAALGGPFNTDQASLNIASYLTIGQFNTIELGSSQLGRIDATVFIQTLMGV